MLITKEKLISDANVKGRMTLCSICIAIGVGILFLPALYTENSSTDFLISEIFLLLVFTVPAGYLLGFRNIVKTIRLRNAIRDCTIDIRLDTIQERYVRAQSRPDDTVDKECQLELTDYSEKTGRTIAVPKAKYMKLKKGDQCILLFEPNAKKPFLVYYPQLGDQLDEELSKLVAGN